VKRRGKIYALYAVLVLSIGAAAFFGFSLYNESRMIGQAQSFYADAAIPQMPRPTDLSAGSGAGSLDFDTKREDFPDIVAWIQSYGTVINYPVVQSGDNDHYLNHLPDGSPHWMGSIFMDYRNTPDFSDPVTLIYGHEMPSGDKFGSLTSYHSQEFFDDHDSMFIFTPHRDYTFVILGGYIINQYLEHPPMSFRNPADFYVYTAEIAERSVFTSRHRASYGDRLVILVTCTPGGVNHERLLIIGKLV